MPSDPLGLPFEDLYRLIDAALQGETAVAEWKGWSIRGVNSGTIVTCPEDVDAQAIGEIAIRQRYVVSEKGVTVVQMTILGWK